MSPAAVKWFCWSAYTIVGAVLAGTVLVGAAASSADLTWRCALLTLPLSLLFLILSHVVIDDRPWEDRK